MRAVLLLSASWLLSLPAHGQDQPGAAISYSRSVSAPLNALLLHDKAMEAWNWTFGREPGARLVAVDRAMGQIEGTARLNFRSAQLALREETMGSVHYRVVVSTKAGECRVQVTDLSHTGNRSTPRGGVHLGMLMRGEATAQRVAGVGGGTAKRIHAEVKSVADARILALLQAFEARLRAQAEP
jgi:hypothetical protein